MKKINLFFLFFLFIFQFFIVKAQYRDENKIKYINYFKNFVFQYQEVKNSDDNIYFYIDDIDLNFISGYKINYIKNLYKEITQIKLSLNNLKLNSCNLNFYFLDNKTKKYNDEPYDIYFILKDNDGKKYISFKYYELKNNNKIEKEEKIEIKSDIPFLIPFNLDIFFYFLNFDLNYKNNKIYFLFFNKIFDGNIKSFDINLNSKKFGDIIDENFIKNNFKSDDFTFNNLKLKQYSIYLNGIVKIYIDKLDLFLIEFSSFKLVNLKKLVDNNSLLDNLTIFGGFKIKDRNEFKIYFLKSIFYKETQFFNDFIKKIISE